MPSNTSTSVSMSPPRTLAMAAVTLLIGATIARVFITISPSPVMMAMAPRTRTAMPSFVTETFSRMTAISATIIMPATGRPPRSQISSDRIVSPTPRACFGGDVARARAATGRRANSLSRYELAHTTTPPMVDVRATLAISWGSATP